MTLSTTTVSQSYSGNGSTTAFTFTFPINSTSELKVIERSATGAETVKSEGTGSANYSIVDNGASGGTVTMVTAPASGTTLVLIRDTSLTQESDYVENDPFAAETHEDALDKLQMQIQEVQEEVDRSMKLSRTNTMTSTEFTNSATDRASKVLAFDSSGELSVTQELGTFKGDSATTTTAAYVIRDIVKSTTTAQLNNIYICIQASPIGTALTNASYWTLIVDAVSAATSATTATTKASEAASSATAAASSASTASGHKDTATTKASEAATSATNAATTLTTFQRQYHGAASSDPSSNLDAGDLYFKTDGSGLKVYTGSAWVDIKPTSSEQTNINTLAASAVVADMAILATDAIVADMAILATDAIVADMAILGTDAIVADMAILATTDVVNDMNVLGTTDVVNDMNVLGTSANVTAMGLLGTAAVVEDLSILGTSTVVSNMATLAGSGNAPSVTNVTASGTMQFGSLSDGTITITDFVDEDNMASDSAVKIPTQQSVKAYVDSVSTLSLIDEDDMATDSATRPPSQQSVKAFAESLTGTNIVATGALNAGSITSGFGNINTGSSTITTTGAVATGALSVTGAITATAASTITTADNTDTLSLISTDADATSGPHLRLFRNSSSPADSDDIGKIIFSAENSASEEIDYGIIRGDLTDVTDGTEDGVLKIETMSAGSSVEMARFGDGVGVSINETGNADVDFRVESDSNAHMFIVNAGNNLVGIGADPDLGAGLHIKIADSGATATAHGDELVIEDGTSGANVGMSILSNTNGEARINFGDSDDNDIGMIRYDHADNKMHFVQNNASQFTISGSTAVTTLAIVDDEIASGGETAPDVGTGGLTLNQGASDNRILTFKSSDVAHGVTNDAETDTYASFQKASGTKGGMVMKVLAEDMDSEVYTMNIINTADLTTTKSRTGLASVVMGVNTKGSGTSTTFANDNGNLFCVRNYIQTKFIVDAEGELHSDGGAQSAYDTYEDAHLVRAYDLSHGNGVINSKFDKFISYNHEALAEAKLVGREEDGTPNHMINVTGMQRLHNGAIWQQYEKTERLAKAVYELAKAAVGEDKANEILEQNEIKLLN